MNLTAAQIDGVRSAIARAVGVVVRPEVAPLEQFCAERLAARGLDSVEAYVALVSSAGLYDTELTAIAEQFAVRESHFFRDPKQLAAIEQAMATRHRKLRRPLSVWVAACAAGEEAYTVAMSGRRCGVPLEILGTDINENLIHAATKGVFGSWATRHVGPESKERFFVAHEEGLAIHDDLRSSVSFRVHNLLDPATPPSNGPSGKWDLILCRNVLIYFDEETVRDTAERLARALAPEGLLFVSSAESLHNRCTALLTVAAEQGFAYAPSPDEKGTPRLPARTVAGPALRDSGSYESIANALSRISRDEAIERLRSRRRNGCTVHESIFLAGLLLEDRRAEEAICVLEDAALTGDLLAETWYLLGWASRMQNQLDVARQNLRKAVFLDSSLWPATYTLATVLKDLREIAAAKALYRRTLELMQREHSCGDRDHLPGVREFFSYLDEVQEVCRRFA